MNLLLELVGGKGLLHCKVFKNSHGLGVNFVYFLDFLIEISANCTHSKRN